MLDFSGHTCPCCNGEMGERYVFIEGEPASKFVCMNCRYEQIVYDYEREEDDTSKVTP